MHAQSEIGEYNSNYIRKSTIIVPFAHSPGIIYAPNTDEYVLMHVHNLTDHDTPPCTECTAGYTVNCTAQNNMTVVTSIMWIDDLSNADDINQWNGPMRISAIPPGESTLAGQIMDDGSFLGMMEGSGTTQYLVTASNWKDNKTWIVHTESVLFPVLAGQTGTEDFYPYQDCKGRWHSLFHNRSPNYYHGDQTVCGAHAFSEDGVNWIYGGVAFTNTVEYDDGEMYTFGRRERPHLVFDANDSCTPVALTTAVEYYKDATFTFIQSIKH